MRTAVLAPAKVNLFLHVGPLGADGYHPLASLMTFADFGDRLSFEPGKGQYLQIEGPSGAGLSAGEDNLVLRAARALLAHVGRPDLGFTLTLDKRLPVASGLGGGSSDAGAALRLLNAELELGVLDGDLLAIAAGLGADGAACFVGEPVLATGRGERLSPAPLWPDLACVLVNPGAPSSTAAVYRAFDAANRFARAVEAPHLPDLDSAEAVADLLADLRNDLEAPAAMLEPAIGEALAVLRAQPEALLARMSGSGATCFALCRGQAEAQALTLRLFETYRSWWIRPCTLAGAR